MASRPPPAGRPASSAWRARRERLPDRRRTAVDRRHSARARRRRPAGGLRGRLDRPIPADVHGRCSTGVHRGGRWACRVHPGGRHRRSAGGNSGLVGGSVPRSDDDHADDPRPPVSCCRSPGSIISARSTWRPCRSRSARASPSPVAGARPRAGSMRRSTSPPVTSRRSAAPIATNAGGRGIALRHDAPAGRRRGGRACRGDVVGSLAGLPKETAGLHWPSLWPGRKDARS